MKTKYHHQQLAAGRWFEFGLIEQLANIGSEVERTILWRDRNPKYSQDAFYRCLELIDLTVADPKNRGRLKEVLRTREALADYFVYDNEYHTSDEIWRKYFYQFAYAAQMAKKQWN